MKFVTFEIAKKLKEKGFKEACLLHYESTGGFYSNSIDTYDRPNQELDYSDFLKCFNEGNSIGLIDAPTISQVLKWLREERKILITIIPQEKNLGHDTLCFGVYRITEDLYQPIYNGTINTLVDSYEEIALAGIEYTLDNLI